MKTPNGAIQKIMVGVITIIVIGAIAFAGTQSMRSIDEKQVRTIIDDKLAPLVQSQDNLILEVRELVKKTNSISEKQVEVITLIKIIDRKLTP